MAVQEIPITGVYEEADQKGARMKCQLCPSQGFLKLHKVGARRRQEAKARLKHVWSGVEQ